MSSSTLADGMRHLRSKFAQQCRHEDSDEQLLHAFTNCRDDSAFAVLVRRHGPMVLHVCRGVLGHHQDAEDAFQATFLVLALNAAMLRKKTTLASFLHGTAYRTAMKAKQSAARRRKHEGSLGALTQPRSPADPADELSWREVRTLLDEEIARLPEIYRSVFVLCCLENVSREEAARRLGLKDGTVSSRLAEARKRLSQRLARRGVEVTAVLAATSLATQTASALPAGLIAATTKAAMATAAGEGLGGVVSASVAELVKGMTAAMVVSKAKIATVVLLAVSVLAGASAWAYRGLAVNALTPSAQSAEPPAAKTDDKPKTAPPKPEASRTVVIQGRVLGPDGRPKAGAKLFLLGERGKALPLGTTAADGRFTVAIPKDAKNQYLVARAKGTGLDFLGLPKGKSDKPIELRLVKDRPIRGRIVNTEGKPVAGVHVAVQSLRLYAQGSVDRFLSEWKQRHFMSGIPGGDKGLWFHDGLLSPTTTAPDGRFVLHGLGEERIITLGLKGAGIAEDDLHVVNRGGFDPKPYNQASLDNIPKGMGHLGMLWLLYGPDLSVVAEAEKIIRGTVKDADTGKGRPGVLVQLTRREGSNLLRIHPRARTDAQGRFEMHGARKAKRYMLEVGADTADGYLPCQVWAADKAGYEPLTMDIAVKKGVVVTGRLLDGGNGKPVRGSVMIAALHNNPFVKDYPSFGNSAWFPMQRTDADGRFRVIAIPGPVLLMGGPVDFQLTFEFKPPAADPKYPQYFEKRFPESVSYYNHRGSISLVQGNACKVLEIKPDAQRVEQDILLKRASVLPVHVQDADGKPLPGCHVGGTSPRDFYSGIQCPKAECPVYGLEPGKPRLLVFFHAQRKVAGTLSLKGDEKAPVVAKLGPPGLLKGRLLDAGGKPLAGVMVDLNYRQRAVSEVDHAVHRARQIVTDAEGMFTAEDLIPGQKLELSFRRGKQKFKRTPKPAHPAIEVKAGECRELGTVKVTRVPE